MSQKESIDKRVQKGSSKDILKSESLKALMEQKKYALAEQRATTEQKDYKNKRYGVRQNLVFQRKMTATDVMGQAMRLFFIKHMKM